MFDRVSKWLNTTGHKIYHAVRAGVQTGYNAVKTVAHTIGNISNGIDSALEQAKSIPLIGAVASEIKNNPLYAEANHLIHTGVNVVDDVGKVGSLADKIITPLVDGKPSGN